MIDAAILLAWFGGAVASAVGTIIMWALVAPDKEARVHAIMLGAVFAGLAVLSVVQAGERLELIQRGHETVRNEAQGSKFKP
jgi:hypothetical protein